MNMKKIIITFEDNDVKIECDPDISAFEAIGLYRYLEKSLFVSIFANFTKAKKAKTKTSKL